MQKFSCRVRVADGGLFVDAEDESEVERVGAVGEGLFELAVDAESFEGGGEVAGGPGGPELAGRAEFDGGLLGDQQVGVGGVRPAVAAVVEPVQDGTAGEVVERADVAADGDAPVSRRVRTQASTSRRMPGDTPQSLRPSHRSTAGARSSLNNPRRSSTSAVRTTGSPRTRKAGKSSEYRINSPSQ
ncbi:hypothetical protein [Streptomyces sp. NPDC000880]